MLAVAAAGERPAQWRSVDGRSMLDFVRSQAGGFARRDESRASAGKLALALAAADFDPRRFGGLDLKPSMTAIDTPTTGAFGSSNWDQALNMLGWRATGEAVPVTATLLLIDRANSDGGWGWSLSAESDVDTTALAVQALVAAGEPVTSTAVVSGLSALCGTSGR